RHHHATYGDLPYDAFVAEFLAGHRGWDPDAWADLFRAAGARYVVLVTKHHDGVLLWPSAHRNPHKRDWQASRDIVGELAAAVRARGMRFGTYYSGGLDWTFPSRGERSTDHEHRGDARCGAAVGRVPRVRRRALARAGRALRAVRAVERHRL